MSWPGGGASWRLHGGIFSHPIHRGSNLYLDSTMLLPLSSSLPNTCYPSREWWGTKHMHPPPLPPIMVGKLMNI